MNIDLNARKPNFPRQILRARAKGGAEAALEAKARAGRYANAWSAASRTARQLGWDIKEADSRDAWHKAARNVVEAAPRLPWIMFLSVLGPLVKKKPKLPTPPLWRQLLAATREATDRAIASGSTGAK